MKPKKLIVYHTTSDNMIACLPAKAMLKKLKKVSVKLDRFGCSTRFNGKCNIAGWEHYFQNSP